MPSSAPPPPAPGIRWGLCCLTQEEPIRFRTATHAHVAKVEAASGRDAGRRYLSEVVLANAHALLRMLQFCDATGISLFRVSSDLCPLITHPVSGYELGALPDGPAILAAFLAVRWFAEDVGIALSSHPSQFVVLNSIKPHVVDFALREMAAQAAILSLLGGDVLCLHGGGAPDGKPAGLDRLKAGIERLPSAARGMLALENDDRTYAASDLLPVCLELGVPLVLDAHHHRVLPGELSLVDATLHAVASWGERTPYFHVSSPREGWGARDPRPHHDFIDPADVPDAWLALGAAHGLRCDVEAKAKELAIFQLRRDLAGVPAGVRSPIV
jgi:UV DNA damage endonuclease